MEEPLKAQNNGDEKEAKEDNKDNDVVEVSRPNEHPIGQDLAPANICEQRTSEECIVTTDADTTTEAGSESETIRMFQFGSSGEFMFGSGEAVKTDSEDNVSSFSFGRGSTSDNQNMKDTSPGFSFDKSVTSETAATDNNGSTGFKFGVEQETETEVSAKLKEKNPSREIVRNLKASTTSVAATSSGISSNTPASKGFQFSDKHKMGSREDMSPSDPTETKCKKGIYLSNLKNLNIQVTAWIKCHVDTNPLIDLTPVFKDYEKHIEALKKKFQASTSFTTPSALTTTTLSSTNSSFGSGSGFGFLKNCEKEQESTEKELDDGREEPVVSSSPQKPAEPVVEEDAPVSKTPLLFQCNYLKVVKK